MQFSKVNVDDRESTSFASCWQVLRSYLDSILQLLCNGFFVCAPGHTYWYTRSSLGEMLIAALVVPLGIGIAQRAAGRRVRRRTGKRMVSLVGLV